MICGQPSYNLPVFFSCRLLTEMSRFLIQGILFLYSGAELWEVAVGFIGNLCMPALINRNKYLLKH
jgi:hypothetical protein